MAHNRKKPTPIEKQKLAQAHHKQEFLGKVRYVLNTLAGEDLYANISDQAREVIYNFRSFSYKFIPAPGECIPSNILKDAKEEIICNTKQAKINLPGGPCEVTLYDFHTVILTLMMVSTALEKYKIRNIDKIVWVCESLRTDEEFIAKATLDFYTWIIIYCLKISDISRQLYWMEQSLPRIDYKNHGIENEIIIHCTVPESKIIDIFGNPRPVTRIMAYQYNELISLSLTALQLGLKHEPADKLFPVYIQAHALKRLEERLDPVQMPSIQLCLIFSLVDTEVIIEKNSLLIAYILDQTKVGYMKADIIDDCVIIRTFLFLTNNGTPEGQKLEEVTGLRLLDKKYLAIDKLSSFMNSDIGYNVEIRKIFEKAGCASLLDIYSKLKEYNLREGNFKPEWLLRYLKMPNLSSSELVFEAE